MSHETFFDAHSVQLSSQATMELLPDMTPLANGQLSPYSDAIENQKDTTVPYRHADNGHKVQPRDPWPLNMHDTLELAYERAISPLAFDADTEDVDFDLDDDDDDDLDIDFDDDDDDDDFLDDDLDDDDDDD